MMRLKNKIVPIILIAGILGLFATISFSSILGSKSIYIDFRNPTDLDKQAIISDTSILTLSKDGWGWEGEGVTHEGWFKTKPLAIGLSWRPTFVATIRVVIKPKVHEIDFDKEHKMMPDIGDIYVRYSSDLVHWSTWQALQHTNPQPTDGRYFNASIRVPYQDRGRYGQLLTQYSMLDVPWKSDEEAAVKWILKQQPDFFTKNLPFIGYIEFLYENTFYSGQKIQTFQANVSYGISGLHAIPKDQAVYKDRDNFPWRFDASSHDKK